MDDNQFVEEVKRDLEEIRRNFGYERSGDQFAVWFAINVLQEEESKVIREYILGGSGELQTDIGICDDDHEVNFVIQCKYTENPREETFSRALINEVLTAMRSLNEEPTKGNKRRQEFAKRLNESTKPTRKIAVGFGRFAQDARNYAMENGVEIYDFQKIKQRYMYSQMPIPVEIPQAVSFNVSSDSVIEESGEGFKAYTFLADAKDLFEAVNDYADGLFEENLRYRLVGAAKSKIGKAIKDTICNQPGELCILNNGITLTTNGVHPAPEKLTAYEPQVVNGCQTCWAIYDACNELQQASRLDTLRSKVYVKLIKTDDKDLIVRVAKASNTQNPISERDRLSTDPLQKEKFFHAFDHYDPPILYEYRDGLRSEYERRGAIGRYKVPGIRGRCYRKIDNRQCGQLYLALLGSPHLCKSQKKQIFENDGYYKTIFDYTLPAPQRFKNDEIGITPEMVTLRTENIEYFVEDTVFAYGIYKLAEAFEEKYYEKLGLYDEAEKETSTIYEILASKHDFLTKWHYYVVAAINYVVEKLKSNNDERTSLRKALIGSDLNRIWHKNLAQAFDLNQNKDIFVILNEETPSTEFPLFARWIISLTQLMYKLVSEKMGDPDWKSMRNFLDLNSNTFSDFKYKIDEKIGGPRQERERWFPNTI